MTTAQENWAIVRGVVVEVSESGLSLNVIDAKNDGDYPNMFEWAIGKTIRVIIPSGVHIPAAGTEVNWRMRIVSPGTAIPDPASMG